MATAVDEAPLIVADTAKECLERSRQVLAETGHYSGLRHLELKRQEPIKYESLHARLRAGVTQAKETARRITASTAVREEGEFITALYTLEGDAIVLSSGIMIHVHTMSSFIKWMISNDYEDDPGIAPGDVFGNNDSFIGNVHPADMMDVMPIHWEEKLIGWVGAVSHLPDIGGVEPGSQTTILPDRFGEALAFSAEKIGSNDALHRTHLLRLERNLRSPVEWILDEKAKVSSCQEVRETVFELITDFGLDYYLRATREFIEECRRAQLQRVKQVLVPGRYRGVGHFTSLYKDKPNVMPGANFDQLVVAPVECTVGGDGSLTLDFEGTPESAPHSANCTPAAMHGGLFVSMTQMLGFDKINDGASLCCDLRLPSGSLFNPTDTKLSTSGAWASMLVAFAAFQRCLSRGFFARGFREEIMLGGTSTSFLEIGGFDRDGHRFGLGQFEIGAGGSGARGIMDGIDTGWTIWNPEGDMGSIESWELDLPLLYLGRRNLSDGAGAGKFRAGATFGALYKVHGSNHVILSSKYGWGHVFGTSGIFGGYPPSHAMKEWLVQDSNIDQLIAEQQPLPHSISADGETIEVLELLEGRKTEVIGQMTPTVAREGDVYAYFNSTAGGYGSPLEREPERVVEDVRNGDVSLRAARSLYGVIVDGDGAEPTVDEEGTLRQREAISVNRRQKAVPTADWLASERERVRDCGFIDEVCEMYRSVMRISPQFKRDFRDFWTLPDDWEIAS